MGPGTYIQIAIPIRINKYKVVVTDLFLNEEKEDAIGSCDSVRREVVLGEM